MPPSYRVADTAPAMTRLLRVLRDVGEPITLTELAQRACMSRDGLSNPSYRLALIERGHMHQHGWVNHPGSGAPTATYLPGPSVSPPPPRRKWTVDRAREASRAWKARSGYQSAKTAAATLRRVASDTSMWAILK